jgi:hypothetical protein
MVDIFVKVKYPPWWIMKGGTELNIAENLSPAMGQGIDSRNRVWNWAAKLHRLTGRYDNPMPTWFLAPIAGLKLPKQMIDGKLRYFDGELRMGFSSIEMAERLVRTKTSE